MKRFLLFCFVVGLLGCASKHFDGQITVQKTDGHVTNVKVLMPYRGDTRQTEFEIKDREDLNRLIDSLESLLIELRSARDQMPVKEPRLK